MSSSSRAQRWGGEEFLLCLDGVDAAAALIRAEQLRDVILANPVVVDGVGALAVRVSIGFACLPFDPAQPQRLGWERVIALADAALYLAKQEGRNRVVGVAAAGPLPPHFEALLRGPATAWLGDPALRVLRAPAAAP
jgi:diguanylate cyclase (GGDEF)-like protein